MAAVRYRPAMRRKLFAKILGGTQERAPDEPSDIGVFA
jgi:hypothetical protein